MRTTPRSRRWSLLGAAAALASAAFALPALAQGPEEAPATARPDWAGSGEQGERHGEVVAELEGLDSDAVIERLAERHAERTDERAAEREGMPAERAAERAERHAEVVAELEGLEGEELSEKLEELHAERQAFRAERQAERDGIRAERQAEREAMRAERQAERAGRGFGPGMGTDED